MRTRLVMMALLWAPSWAFAEEAPNYRRGQGWSLLSGQTIGPNQTALQAELGWPGLSAMVLYGASSAVDVGARVSFNYGFEGVFRSVVPGIKLQGVMRARLVDNNRVNLGLRFAPGPLFYFESSRFTSSTTVGLALPLDLAVGIPVSSSVMVNFGLDVPLFLVFGSGGGLWLPILPGAGAEYYISNDLLVSFNARMGPTINPTTRAQFTLQAQLGVGYRL